MVAKMLPRKSLTAILLALLLSMQVVMAWHNAVHGAEPDRMAVHHHHQDEEHEDGCGLCLLDNLLLHGFTDVALFVLSLLALVGVALERPLRPVPVRVAARTVSYTAQAPPALS